VDAGCLCLTNPTRARCGGLRQQARSTSLSTASREYVATGTADSVRAVLNSGAAYFAKFEVYQRQQPADASSILQVLTLLAVLYTPLMP